MSVVVVRKIITTKLASTFKCFIKISGAICTKLTRSSKTEDQSSDLELSLKHRIKKDEQVSSATPQYTQLGSKRHLEFLIKRGVE